MKKPIASYNRCDNTQADSAATYLHCAKIVQIRVVEKNEHY